MPLIECSVPFLPGHNLSAPPPPSCSLYLSAATTLSLWVLVSDISPEGKVRPTSLQGPHVPDSILSLDHEGCEMDLGLLGLPQPPHSLTHCFVVLLLFCSGNVGCGLLQQEEQRDETEAELRQRQLVDIRSPKAAPLSQRFHSSSTSENRNPAVKTSLH